MESALNLPPVGFINVSMGPVLISLNINLLIADPARLPFSLCLVAGPGLGK